MPTKSYFIRSLAVDHNDASNTLFEHQVRHFPFFSPANSFLFLKVLNEMIGHASDMSSVLQKISSFYVKHGLDAANVV